MKTLTAIFFMLVVGLYLPSHHTDTACAQQRELPAEQPAPVFQTIQVTIDPQGKPLGAYQFELTAEKGTFTVVGLEAGDHPAFDHDRPPYFDRSTLQRGTDRLIVAEYARPDVKTHALPTKPVHLVTVHVMSDAPIGTEQNDIELKLITAGDADGQLIDATVSYTIPERPER